MKDLNLLEENILGTMMKEQYLILDGNLEPKHFTIGENIRLLEAFRSIRRKGMTVDIVTLSQSEPEAFGGLTKVTRLQSLGNIKRFDEYSQILIDNWREREKNQVLNLALQEGWDISTITEKMFEIMADVKTERKYLSESLVNFAEKPFYKTNTEINDGFGLADADKMIRSIAKGKLTIIGARPSMGKSDVMLQIARHHAKKQFLPIIFSLEMIEEELTQRVIAAEGNINRYKFEDLEGRLSEDQKKNWMNLIGQVSQQEMIIFDKPAMTIEEIRLETRKIAKENPDREVIVLIDYLTLIGNISNAENPRLATGRVTRELKVMSKEFNCPVVCLAQLNRGVEMRQDKRPLLSDLRESGSIEEDADCVIFIYRDDYYDPESEAKGMMELIVAKQRGGARGTVIAAYKKETGRLINIDWGQN